MSRTYCDPRLAHVPVLVAGLGLIYVGLRPAITSFHRASSNIQDSVSPGPLRVLGGLHPVYIQNIYVFGSLVSGSEFRGVGFRCEIVYMFVIPTFLPDF